MYSSPCSFLNAMVVDVVSYALLNVKVAVDEQGLG